MAHPISPISAVMRRLDFMGKVRGSTGPDLLRQYFQKGISFPMLQLEITFRTPKNCLPNVCTMALVSSLCAILTMRIVLYAEFGGIVPYRAGALPTFVYPKSSRDRVL